MSRFIENGKCSVILSRPYAEKLAKIVDTYQPTRVTKVSLVEAGIDMLVKKLAKEGIKID